MSTTIPALTSVTDILDNDLVMITHSNGESFKIAGSEINKRNQAVIASTTTMTGAPLKTGIIVRVYFTADITGSNTTTGLVINYNNVNYSVKVPKNGTLANFVASDLGGSPAVYKYLQANTMLELLYDGTQFIIIGNPLVLSGSGYEIHADGMGKVNSVAVNNMNSVTSNAVEAVINGHFLELPSPGNTVTYAKIGIRNYTKSVDSVFIAFNCYSMWGVIRESNQCFYRGLSYGIQGISYTPNSVDSNNFFWIKYTNFRSIEFVSSKELYVIEKKITAPSGVTFTAPVEWT